MQFISGTGIHPWWRYQEASAPGDGRVMINVGTGNLVFQDDDMAVPHKGIALDFRRTYNSQTPASYTSAFETRQSLYGNGWTNTFDAHIVYTSVGHYSVYDIDGARYDYVANGVTWVPVTPGNYATFTFDGACGWSWTKKNGTTYYFWRSSPSSATCPGLSPIGGYAGRLHQIIGRNSNVSLTLNYSWDVNSSGVADASDNGKISAISVQAESGLTATLSFGDVAGRRLLQQITYPDGLNSVNYGYDSLGNLTSVTKAANNDSGTRPQQTFGYSAMGSGSVLYWAYSPRLNASNPLGADGGFTAFVYAGTDSTTSTVSETARRAVVNPSISDGTSQAVLQPGYPANPYYLYEYYTTGGTNPSLRDTDGHATDWVVDSSGRPTQTLECTSTSGGTCNGPVIATYQGWDANNNLVWETDARNNRSDYAYDGAGNAVAIAGPPMTTSDGTFRPTQLYDYDGNSNVTAFCDEHATHLAGIDIAALPSLPLCAGHAGGQPHAQMTYETPAAEPFGRVKTMQMPGGYTKTFEYDVAGQAGGDYSLPTKVSGTLFTQADGSQRQPIEQFTYDANGNLSSYDKGNGAWRLTYDNMNRGVQRTDPDGVSSYMSYYPDGSLLRTETASQHAGGQGVRYGYDLDGNVAIEIHHHAATQGVTQKWYDGADRLVEVMQPRQPDSSASAGADYALPRPDVWGFEWKTRYLYDLTSGGTPAGMPGPAYGNLYRTQEYIQYTNQLPAWDQLSGTTYDALNRKLRTFDYGANYSASAASSQWFVYDQNNQFDLLTSSGKAGTTEGEYLSYDERGALTQQTFMDGSGTRFTTGKTVTYDANGRTHSVTASNGYGSVTYAYDADSRVLSKTDGGSAYDDAPSVISYSYYPDGRRRGLGVAPIPTSSGGFNQTDLFTYAYRPDGMLARRHANVPAVVSTSFTGGDFNWTYTAAGRFTTRTDPFTGQVIPNQYGPSSVHAGAVLGSVGVVPLRAARAHPRDTIAATTEWLKRAQSNPGHADFGKRAIGDEVVPKRGTWITLPASSAGPMSPAIVVICPPGGSPQIGGRLLQMTVQNCCTDCPIPDPTPPPSPQPSPTPRPAKTFAPLSAAYDAYGQVSTYTLPSGGTYNQFVYDPEGSLLSFWGYGGPQDPSHPAKHVVNAVNIRGELTAQHFFDSAATTSNFNTSWPYFASRAVNGTMLAFRENLDPNYFGLYQGWTPRHAKIDRTTQRMTYNTVAGACVQIGSLLTFSQDASARDVQGEFFQIGTFPPDCSPPGYLHGILSRSYDYQDHLVQWNLPSGNSWPGAGSALQCISHPNSSGLPPIVLQAPGTVNYGWGADGKLAQIQVPGNSNHSVHWDDDELLFTTNGNGTVNQLKVGPDADINQQGVLIVRDRDWTGSQTLSHDAAGYSQWLPPNPFRQSCTPDSPPPASSSYDNPAEPLLMQRSLDGYYDGVNVFQGVRAYDPQTTQWTTPDAYAGEPHDPASQKPFMWNGNNSYRYQDPSGYCIEDFCIGESLFGLGLLIARVIALHGPAITESVAHPGGGMGGAGGTLVRTAALDARAAEFHAALDPIAAKMRATSVIKASNGLVIVTSSEGRLTTAQRLLLRPGEVEGFAKASLHAEIKGVSHSLQNFTSPIEIGVAGQPICPNCNYVLSILGLNVPK